MSKNPPDPWVIIGRIGKTFGVQGFVRVRGECDLADFFENATAMGYWFAGSTVVKPIEPESSRCDAISWLVRWKGFDTPESTRAIRNAWLVVHKDQLPDLEDGYVYWSDLVGSSVETHEGQCLGVISEVFETSASSVLTVQEPSGDEFLVALTPELNADWSPGDENQPGCLKIHLPDGLLEATRTPQHKTAEQREQGNNSAC